MKEKLDTIYIGYEPREEIACDVLIESIKKTSKTTYNIVPIIQNKLRVAGLYSRGYSMKNNIKYDYIDGRPFSTEFSFTRFLVPILNQFSGWAIFMDCDMFVRSDISEVFDKAKSDERKAIWCVKHDYNPKEKTKMDGQIQESYSKKNWSSFIAWNCSHNSNLNLTVFDVNTKSGRWLHNFMWLAPQLHEELIGNLGVEWNWLDGHSPEIVDAKNVHFTTGGPWFDMWKPTQDVETEYVEEWQQMAKEMEMEEVMG